MSHILIADDNEHNRYIARFLLEDAGHDVSQVENGSEAVDAATSNEFDLILMDIQMPVMDGMEATQKIKAAGVNVPIIALTAKAMLGDKEKILSAGCDGYISKPFKVKNFADQVGEFLQPEG